MTYVVGIGIANKGPNDIVQCHDNAISASSGSLKGIGKVMRSFNLGMTSQSHPASNDDENNDDKLDYSKKVLKAQTPIQCKTVDQEGGSDTRQPNSTLVPSVDLDIGRVENVLSKDDTVARSPPEQDGIGSEHGRGQELWLLVNIFEIILLASISNQVSINMLKPHQLRSRTYLGIAVPHSR